MQKPLDGATESLVHVIFIVADRDRHWCGLGSERMWAKRVDNYFELENSPMFVRDIAYKDIVFAEPSEDFEGQLQFRYVKERGGHSTYWLLLEDKTFTIAEKDRIDVLLGLLNTLGATWESTTWGAYTVDLPPGAEINKVRTLLEEFERDGLLRWIPAHES